VCAHWRLEWVQGLFHLAPSSNELLFLTLFSASASYIVQVSKPEIRKSPSTPSPLLASHLVQGLSESPPKYFSNPLLSLNLPVLWNYKRSCLISCYTSILYLLLQTCPQIAFFPLRSTLTPGCSSKMVVLSLSCTLKSAEVFQKVDALPDNLI
jgi:hypothetical protein